LNETEAVNLEKDGCVKEARINVYPTEAQKKTLSVYLENTSIHLFDEMSWLSIDIYLTSYQINLVLIKSYYVRKLKVSFFSFPYHLIIFLQSSHVL